MPDDRLRVRMDDYSYQITSPHSSHLFVRITSPQHDRKRITFSDFLMNDEDEALAIHALELASRSFYLSAGIKIELTDILAGKDPVLEKAELVRRHDRFVRLFRVFGRGAGRDGKMRYEIENSYLEPSMGKYNTIISTSSRLTD